MKNLLPIGSVVLLQGGQKKVMIYGRMQRQLENGKEWDYIACLYPEGNIDPNKCFLFNHDQIDTVYFLGYQGPEEFKFKEIMNEKLGENNSSPKAPSNNSGGQSSFVL